MTKPPIKLIVPDGLTITVPEDVIKDFLKSQRRNDLTHPG